MGPPSLEMRFFFFLLESARTIFPDGAVPRDAFWAGFLWPKTIANSSVVKRYLFFFSPENHNITRTTVCNLQRIIFYPPETDMSSRTSWVMNVEEEWFVPKLIRLGLDWWHINTQNTKTNLTSNVYCPEKVSIWSGGLKHRDQYWETPLSTITFLDPLWIQINCVEIVRKNI